ncbi:Thiol-disulfide isomerase or thioredoxin [Amycolatopsis lurida]|uniref:Alkyl hydroperoxide reductase n=1 Tax=Amycolatopsis lurida NRRL 2430 TaxID=1460371 RepID=A0A2P2FVD2_AMYLU|nr:MULTISPECIES: TlpA disulfide reductase family protein [Amycolatopsis]KFU80697.1 alkyl hydroperoxide reductase [Amycolatopsis lurida NRRL 2430]QXV60180.1 TlpA family protein disulfide reductase [Amycolatopsis sp. TNS106]SED44582.1 Thiol-disulfide isomerase or thioredoxin [Amycolatopsis lurida]
MKRLVAAVVGLALVVTGCTTGKDAVVTGGSFNFVSPGGKVDITYDVADRQPSPTLSGDDLMNEGKQLSIADFPGKVIVLNLWGQWCGPCRVEAPEMQKVYDRTKASGVEVIGIDLRDNDRKPPQDFMRDRKLTYPSIYDPSGRTLLQLSGYPRNIIPSTIVLDKQHRVAAVFLRELLASDLLPVVERLAAEPA